MAQQKKKINWMIVGCVFVVVAIVREIFFVAPMPPEPVKDAPPAKVEAPKKEPECARDDLDCRGNKVLWTAGVFCRNAIEEQARFNFRWTNGFSEPKFDRYEWTNKPGKGITVIGDKVEFQNALGNYLPVTYWCDLPENGENYVAVRVKAGKFR